MTPRVPKIQRERWEERAAIREFLGEQDRSEAERVAWTEIFRDRPFEDRSFPARQKYIKFTGNL